ncbi:MAG: DUF6600 domain-containing protein [Cyclobacteriaceae bacterium]
MGKSKIIRLLQPRFTGLTLLFLCLFLWAGTKNISASPISVSFQVFYDELMPYGDWVEDPHYGFIWIPYVDPGFQPYRTNGHWVMSTFGNTWVSNYDWGWAPFHYGRWFFSDLYGWAWIPDYEWGPSWVNWRTGSGYYGWYPMAPRVQFYVSLGFPAYTHWVFVPRRRLLSRNIFRYYLPGRNVNVIYNQTTVINNTYVYNNSTYVSGPSRSEISRVTKRDIPVYEVNEGRRPGRTIVKRNQIQVYRPEIRQANSQSRLQGNSRPSRVISSDDYTRTRSNNSSARRREATSPSINGNQGVRSETLKNNGIQNNRSAGSKQNQAWTRSTISSESRRENTGRAQNETLYNNRRSPNNTNEQRIRQRELPSSSQGAIRNTTPPNSNVEKQRAPERRRSVSTPAQRQVRPPASNQRQMRTPAPSSRQVKRSTPAQRQVRQSGRSSQRQSIRKAAPSPNSRLNSQPARGSSNSSPRVNTNRTPSRGSAVQRSQRSSNTSRSNSRRGN